MAIEWIASTVLTKYLGKYVDGLSKENLKLSTLSGMVQLEKLSLKKEALEELELPFRIKSGLSRAVEDGSTLRGAMLMLLMR